MTAYSHFLHCHVGILVLIVVHDIQWKTSTTPDIFFIFQPLAYYTTHSIIVLISDPLTLLTWEKIPGSSIWRAIHNKHRINYFQLSYSLCACSQTRHVFTHYCSLVPRLPRTRICIRVRGIGRAWYVFSHNHDVIEIKHRREFSEHKGSVLPIVQWTIFGMYDIHPR